MPQQLLTSHQYAPCPQLLCEAKKAQEEAAQRQAEAHEQECLGAAGPEAVLGFIMVI